MRPDTIWPAGTIFPFGTFGAVIKIKSMFRNCRQLFDVGVAGPLAGFAVVLPALVLGLRLSTQFDPVDIAGPRLEFGEPLLFRIFAELFFSGDPGLINLHPIGWAAWFGMLATSLNLLPIGQLDGGHIVYSMVGQKGHRVASYATFTGLVALSFASWPMLGYLLFAFILLILRFRHPPPYVDNPVLDRSRRILAFIGLAIFVLTFMPIPVQVIGEF
jgi:membrane-associated protease RseP (regulator of RpoE activity)